MDIQEILKRRHNKMAIPLTKEEAEYIANSLTVSRGLIKFSCLEKLAQNILHEQEVLKFLKEDNNPKLRRVM